MNKAIMKKILVLLSMLIIAPLLAAMYGVLHDQLTYTICPEYYTKFKFLQFGLVETGQDAMFQSPRAAVALVGMLATWWMGIPIGIILGLIGLVHSGWKDMLIITLQTFALTITVTFITGLIGLGYGYYSVKNDPSYFASAWYLPKNLVDFKSFVAVGSMHNFSYIGGVTGLFAAIYYALRRRFTMRPFLNKR